MLNTFIKSFDPEILSHTELIQHIKQIIPEIIELSSEEQIMYWEFIGSKMTEEQREIVSLGINDLFYTEKQKLNYAQGIINLSFDIAEFNQSLKDLKKIKNPDKNIQSAIKALEELQVELEKRQHKLKLN